MNGYIYFSDPPDHYTYRLSFPTPDWPRVNDPSFIGIFFSKCRIGSMRPEEPDQRRPGVYFRLDKDLQVCLKFLNNAFIFSKVCLLNNTYIIPLRSSIKIFVLLDSYRSVGCRSAWTCNLGHPRGSYWFSNLLPQTRCYNNLEEHVIRWWYRQLFVCGWYFIHHYLNVWVLLFRFFFKFIFVCF